MNKDEKISQYIKDPVKIGDLIKVQGFGSQNKESWFGTSEVKNVINHVPYILEYGKIREVTEAWKKDSYTIGANPFVKHEWMSRLNMISYSLESIMYGIGFDKNRVKTFQSEKVGKVIVPELNWNPIIINKDGNEICYQRDFVWSKEDNQLLIESIYNNLDIGKIIIRRRSWSWVEKRATKGIIKNTAFKDIVDGKQRLNAIITFLQNKYKDLHGNYFKDLSKQAQNTFMDFGSIAYGELGEAATDEDVQATFLNINFTGIQMSKEHIDFVKSIELK